MLACLGDDAGAQTGDVPWARHTRPASSSPPILLAFFDSKLQLQVRTVCSYTAMWAPRIQCELAGSGALQYFLTETDSAQSHSQDMEELINIAGGVLWLGGSLDAASVEVESMEVPNSDFLVLALHST